MYLFVTGNEDAIAPPVAWQHSAMKSQSRKKTLYERGFIGLMPSP